MSGMITHRDVLSEAYKLKEKYDALKRSHAELLGALEILVNSIGSKPAMSVDKTEKIAFKAIANAKALS